MTRTILHRTLLVGVVALCTVYVGDDLALHYRIASRGAAAATGTVTVLYGTPLKNGQVSIFWNQPQTETCVRSIFPHLGSPPCWYARRHATRLITETYHPLPTTTLYPPKPELSAPS
jgi:hypothetical protein